MMLLKAKSTHFRAFRYPLVSNTPEETKVGEVWKADNGWVMCLTGVYWSLSLPNTEGGATTRGGFHSKAEAVRVANEVYALLLNRGGNIPRMFTRSTDRLRAYAMEEARVAFRLALRTPDFERGGEEAIERIAESMLARFFGLKSISTR